MQTNTKILFIIIVMKKSRIRKVDDMMEKCYIIKSKFYTKNKINRSRVNAMIKENSKESLLYKTKILTALLKLQTRIDNEIDKLSSKD